VSFPLAREGVPNLSKGQLNIVYARSDLTGPTFVLMRGIESVAEPSKMTCKSSKMTCMARLDAQKVVRLFG